MFLCQVSLIETYWNCFMSSCMKLVDVKGWDGHDLEPGFRAKWSSLGGACRGHVKFRQVHRFTKPLIHLVHGKFTGTPIFIGKKTWFPWKFPVNQSNELIHLQLGHTTPWAMDLWGGSMGCHLYGLICQDGQVPTQVANFERNPPEGQRCKLMQNKVRSMVSW